jgi:hypothetical protein
MRRRLPEALVLVALTAASGCGGERGADVPTPPAAAAAPSERHFEVAGASPTPAPERPRHLLAALKGPTALRARPGGPVLHRLGTTTEFGSGTVLGVLGRRDGWLKVAAAQLPNGRRGWIPAHRADLGGTDYDIRVDRSRLQATLRRDGRGVLRFSVAVGRPGNETPLGRYAVTDKLRPTSGTSPYGCCAVALTGHQTRLEPGWPGGDRLAIHGTPLPETIGTAASLGCMRAPERALEKLMRKVPLGAPVIVRA